MTAEARKLDDRDNAVLCWTLLAFVGLHPQAAQEAAVMAVVLYAALYLHIAAHEGGHYLAAKVIGTPPVTRVEFGVGAEVASFRWRGEVFVFRACPTNGFMRQAWHSTRARRELALDWPWQVCALYAWCTYRLFMGGDAKNIARNVARIARHGWDARTSGERASR